MFRCNPSSNILKFEEDRSVWPTLFLLNVFTALQGTHFYILFGWVERSKLFSRFYIMSWSIPTRSYSNRHTYSYTHKFTI